VLTGLTVVERDIMPQSLANTSFHQILHLLSVRFSTFESIFTFYAIVTLSPPSNRNSPKENKPGLGLIGYAVAETLCKRFIFHPIPHLPSACFSTIPGIFAFYAIVTASPP
jgi:hypothetical protein